MWVWEGRPLRLLGAGIDSQRAPTGHMFWQRVIRGIPEDQSKLGTESMRQRRNTEVGV